MMDGICIFIAGSLLVLDLRDMKAELSTLGLYGMMEYQF